MIFKLLSLVVLATTLSSCVSASITEEDICHVHKLQDIPASPITGITVTASFSKTVNFSTLLASLQVVSSNLGVQVTQFDIVSQQDLAWISKADVLVGEEGTDLPTILLADYQRPTKTATNLIKLRTVLSSDIFLKYFKKPAKITYVITGTPPTVKTDLTNTLCVAAEGSLNRLP